MKYRICIPAAIYVTITADSVKSSLAVAAELAQALGNWSVPLAQPR